MTSLRKLTPQGISCGDLRFGVWMKQQPSEAAELEETDMAKGKYKKKRLTAKAPSPTGTAPVMTRKEMLGEDEKTLTDLDYELQAAQRAAGMRENTYGVWGPIWRVMTWYDSRKVPHTFKRRTYLLLMLFTGWFGGHRWYQGRRVLALLETLFFWTGIPLILLVTDFMEVFPIKADEKGYITMK